jgi:subtilisin family serine protease
VWEKNGIEGEFIVTAHSLEARDEAIKVLSNASTIMYKYSEVLIGFAAKLDVTDLKGLADHPSVKSIAQNAVMKAFQTPVCHLRTQNKESSWGQRRVGGTQDTFYENKDLQYHYDASYSGQGVTAYIIDTGIYIDHEEFEGRARWGFTADSSWTDTDTNGHGTHVAGTVGGATYGIAKHCELVAVKVLGDDGSGSTAGIIAGLDWVATDSKTNTNKCVANMSLGGIGAGLNEAVDNLSGEMPVAVAAGNDGLPASAFTPASSEKAITVGATLEGTEHQKDQVASFSNIGNAVEIFAPGQAITSAWVAVDGNPNSYATISGTSMASPHVCGVAAQVCTAISKETCVGDYVKSVIEKNAEKDILPERELSWAIGGPAKNLFLQNAHCQQYQ